jgi:hypothetical protein
MGRIFEKSIIFWNGRVFTIFDVSIRVLLKKNSLDIISILFMTSLYIILELL